MGNEDGLIRLVNNDGVVHSWTCRQGYALTQVQLQLHKCVNQSNHSFIYIMYLGTLTPSLCLLTAHCAVSLSLSGAQKITFHRSIYDNKSMINVYDMEAANIWGHLISPYVLL